MFCCLLKPPSFVWSSSPHQCAVCAREHRAEKSPTPPSPPRSELRFASTSPPTPLPLPSLSNVDSTSASIDLTLIALEWDPHNDIVARADLLQLDRLPCEARGDRLHPPRTLHRREERHRRLRLLRRSHLPRPPRDGEGLPTRHCALPRGRVSVQI